MSEREGCANADPSTSPARRTGEALTAGLVCALLLAALAWIPNGWASTLDASATASNKRPFAAAAAGLSTPEYRTAREYVIRFYPRWFTYLQARRPNFLAGPDHVSPIWGVAVQPNVDTLYAAAFLDLSHGPRILTIPPTTVTYSLLTLDVYGSVFQTKIQTQTPGPYAYAGTYALVGPDWHGSLPAGVTEVPMPYDCTEMFFRADKYSAAGVEQIAAADLFRRGIRLASIPDYESDPSSGATQIIPELLWAPRLKVLADDLLATAPSTFLKMLQQAMHSSTTRPLSRSDRRLSRRFDRLFDHANGLSKSWILLAAQAAHTQITDRWLSHTGSTNWINFDNAGCWGRRYLDRAAFTEYFQFGNSASTARYYHAFVDSRSAPLDCSVQPAYVLKFAAAEIPEAQRFWSLTAYLPESETLVPNDENKYAVARYTPGLVTDPDGSVTIYIQPTRPTVAPAANWLPVPEGPFDLTLRIYGPKGNTAVKTYVPPAITASLKH